MKYSGGENCGDRVREKIENSGYDFRDWQKGRSV